MHLFFATLFFGKDNSGDIYWMTGNKPYKSNFRQWAALLGYPFSGRKVPEGKDGIRMHEHGIEPDKDKLAPLYQAGGVMGNVKGLLPLYDILLRTF